MFHLGTRVKIPDIYQDKNNSFLLSAMSSKKNILPQYLTSTTLKLSQY